MQKKSILLSGAIIILSLFTLAKASDIASQKAELLSIQKSRFEALVRVDLPALELLLAEDLTYTHTYGETESKTAYLSSLKTGRLTYKAIDSSSVHVRIYGDTAVLTGRGKMEVIAFGRLNTFEFSFIEVQVKMESRWQLVAWQAIRL